MSTVVVSAPAWLQGAAHIDVAIDNRAATFGEPVAVPAGKVLVEVSGYVLWEPAFFAAGLVSVSLEVAPDAHVHVKLVGLELPAALTVGAIRGSLG